MLLFPSFVAACGLASDVLSSTLSSSLPVTEALSRSAAVLTSSKRSPNVQFAISLQADENAVQCVTRDAPDDFMYDCQQEAAPQVLARGGRVLVVRQAWAPPPLAGATFQDSETFSTSSTGSALWPSAVAISRYMEALGASWGTEKNVIEIGGGIGLPSATASVMGAKSVTLTDGDPGVLKIAQQNIKSNNLPNVDVRSLKFADQDEIKSLISREEKYDVILGSDLTYRKDNWGKVVETVRLLSSSGKGSPSTFFYATTPRYRNEWPTLVEELETAGFKVSEVTLQPHRVRSGETTYSGGVLTEDVKILRAEFIGTPSLLKADVKSNPI